MIILELSLLTFSNNDHFRFITFAIFNSFSFRFTIKYPRTSKYPRMHVFMHFSRYKLDTFCVLQIFFKTWIPESIFFACVRALAFHLMRTSIFLINLIQQHSQYLQKPETMQCKAPKLFSKWDESKFVPEKGKNGRRSTDATNSASARTNLKQLFF